MKKIFILPDTHVPFHNKEAFDLALQVMHDWRPDIFICLGDFADFYSVSSHQKSPDKRSILLRDEVLAVNAELDRIDAAVGPKCEKHFIQGNHCERLERYIAQRAPEVYGMFQTDTLFQLSARGYKSYTPYRKHIRIGKVYYTHDTGKAGANAHRQAERAFSDNAVIGHTHRMALEVVGNAKGRPHISGMFGWLGDINAAEYMHQINANRDWALGFGTAYMKKDGTTFFQMHPIVDGQCLVNGKLFGGGK